MALQKDHCAFLIFTGKRTSGTTLLTFTALQQNLLLKLTAVSITQESEKGTITAETLF
jgi:hypothetical protein